MHRLDWLRLTPTDKQDEQPVVRIYTTEQQRANRIRLDAEISRLEELVAVSDPGSFVDGYLDLVEATFAVAVRDTGASAAAAQGTRGGL